MQPVFSATEATFLFPGPAGEIEVLTTPLPEHSSTPPATAVICHPHPLHGGTLRNKVVTTLARTFQELGLRTLRFNFRGVGKSNGVYAEGRGEMQDLLTLIQWVKINFPSDPIWLAGFSFGAYVATMAAMQVEVARLITVAPQVSRFAECGPIHIRCPWILVQGEQDEVIAPAEVFNWFETLNPQPTLIRFPAAGHFFHGQLIELRQQLIAHLK